VALKAALVIGALLLLRALIDAGGVDRAPWVLKALGVGGLIWLGLIAIASASSPFDGLAGLIAKRKKAEGPGEELSAGEAMRKQMSELGGGAYLGTIGAGRWVLADPESAVMVLGPPREGKTSAVMIPAVMSAPGAVISTSTKPEVMRASVGVRSEVGQAWLFDPAGSEKSLPMGVRRLSWSPVAGAGSWDGAMLMARAMCAAGRAGAGTKDESHWSERASALLAPLLHAANLTERPIEEVLRWVLRQDLEPARNALLDADSEIAADVLVGIEATDARERSSIYSATAGVLAAYNADAVRESAAHPNFDPARFAASTDTIYITSPDQYQALCAPLIVGLLEQVRHAVYVRAAVEESDGPQMLWALDEVANIAPIHDLPALISQAGGQGLQVMVGLQDMSQARNRWGPDVAEGFLTLFQTRLVLSGVGDPRFLEAVSQSLGEYDRQVVSQTLGKTESDAWWWDRSPDQYSESVTYQTQRQRVVSPGDIAKLPPGQALLLRGADWSLIGVPRWFEREPWRSAGAELPVTGSAAPASASGQLGLQDPSAAVG
jgi:type IV secretion system protein VirD4